MSELYSPADLIALGLSLRLAVLTSAILLVVATPLALWLARTRSVFGAIVEAIVSLPLVLPPTVLGFYLLCLLAPDGPAGRLLAALGWPSASFSFTGILIGSLVFSLPFVVQSLQNAFMATSGQLLEVAQTLRASPWSAFFSVVLPLSVRGFLSGGMLAFAHTLGEFGVVLMIGGSIPGKTQTASIAIFSHVEALEYRSAHVLSATLVALCFTVLALLYLANRRARPGRGGMTLVANFRLRLQKFTLEVDLDLPASGVTALLGPSGSGKTTLLRCLAGLERKAEGVMRLRGETWQDRTHMLPTYKRPIGYVFQEAGLFPHLSVRKNLEFGLRRVSPAARRIPFEQAVTLLGIAPLLERKPLKLSGGERQRVAIARALLTSPSLLLMDEPLASLDLDSRAQILPYFEALERELQLPIVYVTHAPAEVVRLAHRVVFLEAGRVRASGPLNEVLTEPELPLAHRPDAGSVLQARVIEHAPEYHLTYVSVTGGTLAVSARALEIGACTRVHVHARDVSLSRMRPARSSISNALQLQILDIHPDRDPAHRLVRLRGADSQILLARVTYRSVVELGLCPSACVFAQVKSVALVE